MRVFFGGLGTETNTFAPFATAYDDFHIVGPSELATADPKLIGGPLPALADWMAQTGGEIAFGSMALASPAGKTIRLDYERLRDEFLATLGDAGRIDAAVLWMHGAMVADGYDDCEGDMLERVRSLLGPDIPIGVLLDPHCHLTSEMVSNADFLVFFQEWPHTDVEESGYRLIELMKARLAGSIDPVTSVYDCRMIEQFFTPEEPARSLTDQCRALEGKDGILSVSIVHGFAAADVPSMGTKVLVIGDGHEQGARALAERLGQEIFGKRGQFGMKLVPLDQAIIEALAVEGGAVTLAEGADNVGGGAPGDSSFLLRALLNSSISSFAAGVFWDPVAFDIALKAGEGAEIDLRICGKVAASSGDPLDLRVRVGKISLPDAPPGDGADGLWRTVTLHVGAADILISDRRVWTIDPEVYVRGGVDINQKKVIVAKSHGHFYAKFAPVSKQVIYVDTPGVCGSDLSRFVYKRIDRPKWPLDGNPFEERGAA
jgi:microcystin degradation protein MlrC